MTSPTNRAVADRWAGALARGDLAALADLSSKQMRIWHSFDDQWVTREEGEARMNAQDPAAMPKPTNVRATPTDAGFVVQATVVGVAGLGTMHIVQVCTVEQSQVVSCEEYIAATMSVG